MTKKLYLFLIIILFLFTMIACAEEEHVKVATLDASLWPTPIPIEAKSTYTPFPKISADMLAVVTKTPHESSSLKPTATIVAKAATEMPLSSHDSTESTPTAKSVELSPVLQFEGESINIEGKVSSIGLNVRAGPGSAFDQIVELSQGDTVMVLEQHRLGWIKIRNADGVEGWVDPAFVDYQGKTMQPSPPEISMPSPTLQPTTTIEASSDAPGSGYHAQGGMFVIQLRSGGDIVLINEDGTGLRKLTHGIDPAFSPSGRQVAFTRWEEPSKFSLWKINLDGHGETHIFGNTKQAKSPTWSPDESKIAINFQHGGTLKYTKECDPLESEWSLNPWLVDLRDEDALEFVPDINEETGELEGIDVCWKNPPDAHWKLRVIDITSQTHEDVNIGNYIFRPDWNPINPNQIISSGGIGLVIAEFQDAGKQVALPLTTDAGDRSPSYSPDGRYIVLNYHQRPNWDIHRLNADGTGRVRLTKTPLYVTAVEKKPLWNNVSPVFSPDGSQIAFLTDRNERWEIWVMGMDGSNQHQMFPDSINDQLPILYNMVDERVFDWTYIF